MQHDKRPRRRAISIGVVFALILTQLPASPSSAASAEETTTTAIVQGLRIWARAFGGVSELPEVATPLPLTDVAIRDALELDRVLSVNLEAALLGAAQNLTTLPGIINDADGFSGAAVTVSSGVVALEFDVSVTRTVPLGLEYEADGLRLRGGVVAGGLTATFASHFEFEYDTTETVPQLRFVQVNEPDVVMTAATETAIDKVVGSAVDGFVDVDLAGDYAVDWNLTARMRDPNGRGRLAEEDLEFTAPGDLFRIDPLLAPAPDSVDIDLGITSDLMVGPGPHARIGLDVAAPGDVFPPVEIDRTVDADYRLLTGVDAQTGFASFSEATGAILAAQATYAADVPLLDASLTSFYSPGDVLTDLLIDMARARFACGATNTSPPVGVPAPGGDWYCQGETEGPATNVVWSAPGGTIDAQTDDSLGEDPTANVRITGLTAVPRLEVSYTDGDGELQTARSIVESAQQLSDLLHAHGFDGTLAFDALAGVLTFSLDQTLSPTVMTVDPGEATSLGAVIGLRGLRADGASPTIDVAVGERSLTGGFGLALDKGGDPGTFLTIPNGQLIEIDSIASTLPGGSTLALDGRIGFLGVDVDVDDLSLATISPDPAVAVTVPVTDRPFGDYASVSDAVAISDVLADAGAVDGVTVAADAAVVLAPPEGTIALDMTASLTVSAQPMADGTPILPGVAPAGVDVVWNDLAPSTLPVAVTTPGYDDLRLFDLLPTIAGSADVPATSGAVDLTTELVDSSADFYRDFGLDAATNDPATHVARTITNIDDNTTCTGFTVVSATMLRCDTPLVGSYGPSQWDADDVYVIEGDPFALRNSLFDALISEVAVLQQLGEPHSSTFPLLDLAPSELAAERSALLALLGGLSDAPGPNSNSLQALVAYLGAPPSTSAAASLTSGASSPNLEVEVSQASTGRVTAPLLVRLDETTFATGLPDNPTTAVVDASSTTVLKTGIDLGTGNALALAGTGTRSTADDNTLTGDALAGAAAQLGGAEVKISEATGGVVLGFGVDVRTELTADVELSDMDASMSTTRTGTTGNKNCGLDPAPLADVCASIALVDADGTDLATVEFAAMADQVGPGTGGQALKDAALLEPLAVRFGADALLYLAEGLDVAFDGESVEQQVVLVGPALDAGADVSGALQDYLVDLRPRLRAIGNDVDIDTAGKLSAAVELALTETATAQPIGYTGTPTVTLYCGATACAVDAPLVEVTDMKITTTLTADAAGTAFVAFETGLPGLPLRSSTAIPTTYEPWTVPVTFGIRKATGPYLDFGAAGSASLTGSATLPSKGDSIPETNDLAGVATPHACHELVQPVFVGIVRNDDKCVDAVIGTFPGTLSDWTKAGSSSGTGVDFTTTIAPPAAGPTEFDFGTLATEGMNLETTVAGSGKLTAQFETWAREGGMYDVGGTFELQWDTVAFAGDDGFADVKYDNLVLDKGTWDAMLQPLFEETNKWLAPIRPVLDFLRRPLPVVSELSRATGGPNVSLLTLMFLYGAGSAANKKYKNSKAQTEKERKGTGLEKGLVAGTVFVEQVGKFSDFVADTQTVENPGVELWSLATGNPYDPTKALTVDTPLGSFDLKQDDLLKKKKCSASRGDGPSKRCKTPSGRKQKTLQRQGAVRDLKQAEKADKGKAQKESSKSIGLSIPAIDFPVLGDSSQTYDMLVGAADSTLFRADFGYITLALAFQAQFGPFMVGPVPADVVVGGSIEMRGRFSMGFDTRGLRLATEQLDDPGDPYELKDKFGELGTGGVAEAGFFLDDLDGAGTDIPEMTFVATIYAGAGISIKIFRVGLNGGVEVTITLDANDPDGDGKIRIEEFAQAGGRTECAFNTKGTLKFFLEAVLSIDLGFTDIEKKFRFLESPAITLFETHCDPVTPVLALVRDEDSNGSTDLVLTIGRPTDRQAYQDISKERYVVRQMGETEDGTGIILSVEAFGLEQRFTIGVGGKVFADAGDGADMIRLDPGERFVDMTDAAGETTQALEVIPFTVPAVVAGGPGNDTLSTGDGPDVVQGDGGSVPGDGGSDEITTFAGDDIVTGGDDRDRIDVGPGDDTAEGGEGNDDLTGGPGVDRLFGDDDNDRIIGGPGYDPLALFPSNQVGAIEALLDGGDLLVGGSGSDEIDGDDGSDTLSGGSIADTARTRGTAPTQITVEALVNGIIQSVDVDRYDIIAPTLDEQNAACASGPLATSGGSDDVDVVTGGPDRDYLFGGNGHDLIDGGGGGDLMCGLNGDDVMIGDGGALDPGPDEIRGGLGRDRIFGEGGNDTIQGDHNADMIRGGEGSDIISGGPDADLILGEDGNDTIDGEGVSETVDPSLVHPDVVSSGDDRVVECAATTLIVAGHFDVDDDLTTTDDAGDVGYVEGYRVIDGRMIDVGAHDPVSPSYFTGVLGDLPVGDGEVDLDSDGVLTVSGDTRLVNLARMKSTSANGDCILAGDGNDTVTGGLGGDHIEGGAGNDDLQGDDGKDFVRGNDGVDFIQGGSNDDFLVGDDGRDTIEGNGGDDRIRGGEGDDRLIGGSQENAADGEDALFGGRGNDVLAGQNAVMSDSIAGGPVSPIPGTFVELLSDVSAGNPVASDPWWDELYGGFGDDWLFGQDGDDLVRGGQDDDYVEGNEGDDTIHGDDGNDLVIGGGSAFDGIIALVRDGTGLPDGSDLMYGDHGADDLDGIDVMAGDNARLARGAVPVLFDVNSTDPSVSGGDMMFGDGGADVMFGQGNGSQPAGQTDPNDGADNDGDGNIDGGGTWLGDTLFGDDGDDYIEGNAGNDLIWGGGDQDDLIGGGSALYGTAASVVSGSGLFDGRDSIHGGDGVDFIAGDNARILRTGAMTGLTLGTDRSVLLLDIAGTNLATSGGDYLSGGGDDDVIFGQGNGGQPADQADPNDGLDNDFDGREGAGSTEFDCLDGFDNDDDGMTDGDDPGCSDSIDEDAAAWQGDIVVGGNGDDYIEGNGGADWLHGGLGDDDMVGGSSAHDGQIVPARTGDRLADGPDVMDGGVDDDVMAGDNATINRTRNGDDWQRLSTAGVNGANPDFGPYEQAVRITLMADFDPGANAFGNDHMSGGRGNDEMYGQLGDDFLVGDAGDDALVGDLGQVRANLIGDNPSDPAEQTIASKAPGSEATIYETGSMWYEVRLYANDTSSGGLGGDDVLLGYDGRDTVFGGVGNDVIAGDGDGTDEVEDPDYPEFTIITDVDPATYDDDMLFGGDGDDAMWGGRGDDVLFGGHGIDHLDVRPRLAGTAPQDPASWFTYASPENFQGTDTIYGGWNADALQADRTANGPDGGDHLIDWVGAYNIFYICTSGYGDTTITRSGSPDIELFLQRLAEASGAYGADTAGAAGFRDLGLVFKKDRGKNSNPAHPDAPGHYTCAN